MWSDQWDGYAANRQRLTDQLAGPAVRNAVVLSGDIHSFWVNELRRDALSGKGGTIGTEIVTSALAAQSPPSDRFGDWRANNPHIRFGDITHSGWVSLDITRERLKGEMRAVDRMQTGAPPVTVLTRFEVESGRPIQMS